MAECHPVGFRWVMEAKRRGATVIHVDPRFTRTSAVADLHVPIRAGTDIAFLGGGGRRASVLGDALALGGALALRVAVFTAGNASARDPHATFQGQRTGV